VSKPKHTPAHARPDDADDVAPSGAGPGGAGGAGRTPLATALRDMAPPRHGGDFWSDLDRRLADEPQLRLAPRSAIRPITQPPPVIGDHKMAKSLKGSDIPSPPGPSSRRTIVLVALAVIVLLVVIAAVQSPDDDGGTATDDAPTQTTDGRTPTSDEDAAAPTTAPPPTLPPGTIDPTAPMTPAGVGPLVIGASLADHQNLGMTIQVDDSMFRGSGGRCYEARVQGALDLRLRFRAPDGQRRADDPGQGVLTAVSIESGLPTSRVSDAGIGLGAPQDQVLAAYAGNLDDRSHPFVSGGHIFRADAGNGTGIAYLTDGTNVIGISVGEMDAIRFINECG
jgi:hypothetical protein